MMYSRIMLAVQYMIVLGIYISANCRASKHVPSRKRPSDTLSLEADRGNHELTGHRLVLLEVFLVCLSWRLVISVYPSPHVHIRDSDGNDRG